MDRITPERRSANMRQIKSKGMKPEMAVRRIVHSMGFRFRLHRMDLPGNPDLVFAGRHKAIFVHGCFWHQHPGGGCRLVHAPRSNADYWQPKLARNVARDIEVQRALSNMGWQLMIVWECELRDQEGLANRIYNFLADVRFSLSNPGRET